MNEEFTMNAIRTRRQFLNEVGQGMLIASVGYATAVEIGVAPAQAYEASESLTFGPLEPLVELMQDTPTERLLPLLVERLRSGTELRHLVAAAALANAADFRRRGLRGLPYHDGHGPCLSHGSRTA